MIGAVLSVGMIIPHFGVLYPVPHEFGVFFFFFNLVSRNKQRSWYQALFSLIFIDGSFSGLW